MLFPFQASELFDSHSFDEDQSNSDSGAESETEATPTTSDLVRTQSEQLNPEQLISPLVTLSGQLEASLPNTLADISKQDLPEHEGTTFKTRLKERSEVSSDEDLSEEAGDESGCGYDVGLQDLSIENKTHRPFRDEGGTVDSHTGASVVTGMYLIHISINIQYCCGVCVHPLD